MQNYFSGMCGVLDIVPYCQIQSKKIIKSNYIQSLYKVSFHTEIVLVLAMSKQSITNNEPILNINIWDKVFKNGPSEIYGRKPLKSLKRYSMLKQTISYQFL